MAHERKDDGSAAAAGTQASEKRVHLGSLALDTVSFGEAVRWTLGYIAHRGTRPPARLSCPNAALIALADADPGFAAIVNASELVVADGLPLVWAAALLGTPLGGQIRGVDLMERICAAGASRGLSFYIVGGVPGAAEFAAAALQMRFAGLRLAGVDCPPIGFENDPALQRQVYESIVRAAPDFLIVALGSPKQEWWISECYRELPVGAILGVGAAVDTYAGLRRRPPAWMGRVGLEWFGRLLNEPRRLWRRYAFGNPRFLAIVFRQWRMARRRR